MKINRNFSLGLALSIVFFACQEEKSMVEESPLVTLDDPIAYTEFHFNQLGSELAKLASDPDFRSLVYDEIDKKFDGDNNVLLETLMQEPASPNARVAAGILSTSESFQSSLEAFKNIEGENYYPQIYIPFYEELKEENAKSRSDGGMMSPESAPLFVFFTGDETQEILPAYQLDKAGKFVKTDIMVDEEYALTHEVWVISINERIEDGQVVVYDENNIYDDLSSRTLSARITRLDIKCRKESWLAGKHEIRMRAESTWYGAINPSTGEVDYNTQIKGSTTYDGDDMAKVKIRKRDVRRSRWKVIGMNYQYGSKWNTSEGNYLVYTIFEKDNWPARIRSSARVRVPGASNPEEISINFRSSDSEWIADYIPSGQAGTYYKSNSCIRVYTSW